MNTEREEKLLNIIRTLLALLQASSYLYLNVQNSLILSGKQVGEVFKDRDTSYAEVIEILQNEFGQDYTIVEQPNEQS